MKPGASTRARRSTGSALALALVMTVPLACNQRQKTGDDPVDPTGQLSGHVDQAGHAGDAGAPDDRAPITRDTYEQRMLALSSCELVGEHIDPACPAKKAFQHMRAQTDRLRDLRGITVELGERHIHHESPAVRLQALAFLSSSFAADGSRLDIILKAARKETSPQVLASVVQALGSRGGTHPEIGALLLDLSGHASPVVRKHVAVWLSAPGSDKLHGSIDRLIALIDSDPDPMVREFACRSSGSRGDDRLVATYARYTRDPSAHPRLYSACMEGLLNSWMHYPRFDTHNRAAYRLTLQRLAHEPRTRDAPPWTLMDNFAELARQSNKRIQAWRDKAPWYTPEDVMRALQPIVTDRNAYRLARLGALSSMVALGADRSTLEAMRAAYRGATGPDDTAIARQLDTAVRAASQPPPVSPTGP